jgi:alpha-ribazole phosphatase
VSMPASHRETVLWLIRHPEPEQSAQGVCYGSLDVRLSPAGMQQAEAIAQALASQHLDAICSSPSQRCMDTASKIASGRSCVVQTIDALRELHFGAFEGRSYDEIAALYPELYRDWMERPTETQFPGGETFSQISERVIGITHTLLAQHQGWSIVFVTHGGPIRIILADALGLPMRNIFRIGQRHGAVNRIRYSEGNAVVELMNSRFSSTEPPCGISDGARIIAI